MTIDPAIERVTHAAPRVFAGHGVLVAYAFGSRVSGRPRPDSDLDVGYYRVPDAGRAPFDMATEMRLAQALSDAAGLAVDLRGLDGAPLDLKGRVLETGVRVYSGDDAGRVRLERELLARYHDYKAEFQLMHERRLRAVAERGLR
jgi:predicted nucleotidyltransferase